MKKKRRGAVLAACLAVSLIFPSYGTDTDLSGAKQKADALQEEKRKTEQTLNDLEKLKQDTEAYVSRLDASLNELNEQLGGLEVQITAKEEEIGQTEAELNAAKELEISQYGSMKLRIKYMYEKGDTSYIDLILQSESISQMMNRVEYISKISEYDRRMLNEYAATRAQVAEREAKLKEEHGQLKELQAQTAAKQASVQQLVDSKTAELNSYQARISEAESRLSAYQKDLEAQEAQIRQIEAEIRRREEEARRAAEAAGQTYNTVTIGNISFIWPCPSSGRITSGFGGRDAPMEGASSDHKGIDISAAAGSSIVAAADGDVTISTYSYSAGNYIMINHGGGVSTVYMHCSQLLVSAGEKVKQGQVIAKVGSTGFSTGNHLHFGVRLNGNYVNPAKYVSP